MGSEAQDCSDAIIYGVGKRSGQLPCTFRQPGPIDQLQAERHSDGVPRQTRQRGLEEHVAGETCSVEI